MCLASKSTPGETLKIMKFQLWDMVKNQRTSDTRPDITQDYTRRLVELQQETAMGAHEAKIQMCKLVEEQRRASAALVSFDPDLYRRAMLKLRRDLSAFGGAQPKEFHAAVLVRFCASLCTDHAGLHSTCSRIKQS